MTDPVRPTGRFAPHQIVRAALANPVFDDVRRLAVSAVLASVLQRLATAATLVDGDGSLPPDRGRADQPPDAGESHQSHTPVPVPGGSRPEPRPLILPVLGGPVRLASYGLVGDMGVGVCRRRIRRPCGGSRERRDATRAGSVPLDCAVRRARASHPPRCVRWRAPDIVRWTLPRPRRLERATFTESHGSGTQALPIWKIVLSGHPGKLSLRSQSSLCTRNSRPSRTPRRWTNSPG